MKPAFFRIVLPLVFGAVICRASAGEPQTGWRGNGTGLWPETKAPLNWSRIAKGALEGMRAQANRPAALNEDSGKDKAPAVRKGLVPEWLVLGPIGVADSVKGFDDDLLQGEASTLPNAGDQASSAA